MAEMLLLSEIRTDGGTQSRAAMNFDYIEELAEHMKGGGTLPDLIVYLDGDGIYWLSEGHHRYLAYKKAGMTSVPCEVRRGSLRDAKLHSAGANESHGLRRSDDDKRAAVQMLLQDDEWGRASNRWIAEQCKVSEGLVRKLKASGAYVRTCDNQGSADSVNEPQSEPETVTGQDGKQYPARNTFQPSYARNNSLNGQGSTTSTRGKGGKKGPKNGAEKYRIKEFDKHFGYVAREIDNLGEAYGGKNSREAVRLHKQLSTFLADFKAWYKQLTGAKK
jgi:hypothetical protein